MRRHLVLALLTGALASVPPAAAEEGRVTATVRTSLPRVAAALEASIAEARMGLVCHTDAQRGAAARGVTIPGNQVMMVFRNDFAVRLIKAAPAAAFEAPMRIYLSENADGTTTVTYAKPSALLARYPHPEVQAVGAELDPIFEAIVNRALGRR